MTICAVSHDLRRYEAEQDRLAALEIKEERLAKEIEENLLGERIDEVIAEIMSDNSDGLAEQLEKLHTAVTDIDKLKAADAIRCQINDLAGAMAEKEANDIVFGEAV